MVAGEIKDVVLMLVDEITPVCDEEGGEAAWTKIDLGDGTNDG